MRTPSAAFAGVLEAAGFARLAAAGAGAVVEIHRRAAGGPFVIEARASGEGHVDVGLTLPSPRAPLVGPVHRALSPGALASALPDILASLEALADAAERLRCPDCNGLEAIHEGEDGPFIACGQPRRGRRPFDGAEKRCRRDLVMAALIVHGDPGGG
jgi:hypothetical protein